MVKYGKFTNNMSQTNTEESVNFPVTELTQDSGEKKESRLQECKQCAEECGQNSVAEEELFIERALEIKQSYTELCTGEPSNQRQK